MEKEKGIERKRDREKEGGIERKAGKKGEKSGGEERKL